MSFTTFYTSKQVSLLHHKQPQLPYKYFPPCPMFSKLQAPSVLRKQQKQNFLSYLSFKPERLWAA